MSEFTVVKIADLGCDSSSRWAPYLDRALKLDEGEALTIPAIGNMESNYQLILKAIRARSLPLRIFQKKKVLYLAKTEVA